MSFILFIKKNFLTVLLWIFFFYLLSLRIPSWIRSYKMEGEQARSISLMTLGGETIKIPNSPPSSKVLIFWATWCGPCKLEMNRYQKSIDEKEIDKNKILAINIGESLDIVQKSVQEHAYTFPVALDPGGSAAKLYGVEATPTVVHLTSDGSIGWVGTGVSPTSIYRAKSLIPL